MIAHQIRLRKADISDLSILKYWDEQPHVIASNPNDDWNWDEELLNEPQWRELLIAEHNGKPIGFIQINDPAKEETHYWGDVEDNLRAIDIWIGEKDYVGKGYGTEMMKLAINRCFEDKSVKAILVDPLESNTKAHRFYEKLGFHFLKKERFGEDDCFVYKLSREDWDKIS